MQKLISLSENVIQALNFFVHNPPATVNLKKHKLPFVVGSGNAYNTGVILFSKQAALFADESNFRKLISAFSPAIKNKTIDSVVVISASGEKDSVWEVKLANKHGLHTTLLTAKGDSSASKAADVVRVFKSIDEPYTYNVSTYMGMILGTTREDPKEIYNKIRNFSFPKKFSAYKAYSLVVPDKYAAICPMLDIKKSELFGPMLSLRAFSDGHARHAKFVIRSKNELVISIGKQNKHYGFPKHRWNISIPKKAGFGFIMALTYHIVGKIQETKPQYFKKHIKAYTSDYGPKAYGKKQMFDVIVPGTP